MRHLLLTVPEDWTTDRRGDFFETFVADLLRPMRFKVVNRLRFTGMEIDLLARGEDAPRMILVECKAHRDPLPADVISKLMGNVSIRKADAGWLFTTSDLSKDGRGQWEDIQQDPDLARLFTWYSPEKIIDILIQQKNIVDPSVLTYLLSNLDVGDWTLVITPSKQSWLVQLLDENLPTKYTVFNAKSGNVLEQPDAEAVASLSQRFASLSFHKLSEMHPEQKPERISRAPVARVIPGDAWDDLRPARPADFVGRDDVIGEISKFIEQARINTTQTRTFAIHGPSGWGKSSLVLKLADLVNKNKIQRVSLTAVDTRSATNSAFVAEALRMAFIDASEKGLLAPGNEYRVESLRHPLDSFSLSSALDHLKASECAIVLIFDQFEELFAKEDLFETFTAIRELSLDIDAKQIPLLLGFAWKTDITHPHLHPAYHLWHELADRRRDFKVREFGKRDILKIIAKAEKALNKKLSPALRGRLVEQCLGLPWLLKKLLVHVLQRVSTLESQYLLLERELEVELLFKEDLSLLTEEQIRCLKYVAQKAPLAVAEVENSFSRETTNSLIHKRLLVRSGMNYVIYWDIFRDYLVEERVPHIPWARTFQREPASAFRALQKLSQLRSATVSELSLALGLKEGPCLNLLGDLVALQLIDRMEDSYLPSRNLRDLEPHTVAEYAQGQLRRHIIMRELSSRWDKGKLIDLSEWDKLFKEAHPRTSAFSQKTIRKYAMDLRRWLVFAGLLEQGGKYINRPVGKGKQMGLLTPAKAGLGIFLGSAPPESIVHIFKVLTENQGRIKRSKLEELGLRNAIVDAATLGLIVSEEGTVELRIPRPSREEFIEMAKAAVLEQDVVKIVSQALSEGTSNTITLGERVREKLRANWKTSSMKRYGNGIRRYYYWAVNKSQEDFDSPSFFPD